MTQTATAPEIVLDVHVCAARRSYRATFTGPDAEAHAIAFMKARESTHAFDIDEERMTTLAPFPLLADLLFPTCEHGLSQTWCYDPINHYAPDEF